MSPDTLQKIEYQGLNVADYTMYKCIINKLKNQVGSKSPYLG